MMFTDTAARLWVRAHYVAILAGLTLALAVYVVKQHDALVAARATVQLVTHQQDSVVAVYRDSVRTSSAAIVRDTVRVEHFLASYRVDTLWRHDTLHVAGDTTTRVAVPLPVVQRTDSTIRACSLLVDDCAAFHRQATATMDAQRQEIAALKARPERSCTVPSIVTGVLGIAAGFSLRGRLP